jgi:hypothetical protein
LLLYERHTLTVLDDYVEHFNNHRPHQGRHQHPPNHGPTVSLINEYRRAA